MNVLLTLIRFWSKTPLKLPSVSKFGPGVGDESSRLPLLFSYSDIKAVAYFRLTKMLKRDHRLEEQCRNNGRWQRNREKRTVCVASPLSQYLYAVYKYSCTCI